MRTDALVTSGSTGRVLLVDDMHDDASLLALLLAPLDANVSVASSAAEALGILDNECIDLVVTDLNMPDVSGLDLAREVKRAPQRPRRDFHDW